MIRRLALAALIGLVAAPAAAAERITVTAVAYPLAYFAERLAGDAAEVRFPVPAGRDPRFWRPSIAEIGEIQRSDLILLNGAGFAEWAARTSLPRARTVDTSRAFADRLIAIEGVVHSHGPEGEHSHTGTAAFTWLDFAQAAAQAAAVAEALGKRLPDEAGAVAERLRGLEADLAALDAEARELGAALAGRRLIASHPRYQYFARAYGLAIASVEWQPGETPDAAGWAALDALVGEGPALVILEADPTPETAAGLAERGLAHAVLPTLASPPAEGDFLTAARAGLAALATAR